MSIFKKVPSLKLHLASTSSLAQRTYSPCSVATGSPTHCSLTEGESGYAHSMTSYRREMQLALDAEFAKRLQCNLDFGIETDRHVDADR